MTVPTYGLPKLGTEPRPNVRVQNTAPEAAFGVPAQADLGGVAQIATKYAQEQRDASDLAVVNAKEREIADHRAAIMGKVTAARGHDALRVAGEIGAEWQQGVDSILESVGNNDRVRMAVQRRADGYWANLHEASESHAAAESRKASIDDVNALVQHGLDDVQQDPSKAEAVAEQTKARIADMGRIEGWSPEVTEQEQRAHVSDIHATALGQLIEQERVGEAQGYFNTFGSELIGKQRTQAEKMVTALVEQDQATQTADQIIGINQAQQGAEKPYAQAVAEAEALPNDKHRKDVLQQIDAHYARIERGKRLASDAALERLSSSLEQSGGRINKASADFQLLDHTDREHLELKQKQLLHPADPGNEDEFLHHVGMASVSAETRAQFLATDILSIPGLNKTQRSSLFTLRRQFMAQDANAQKTEERRQLAAATSALKAAKKVSDAAPDDAKALTALVGAQSRVSQLKHLYDAVQPEPHSTGPSGDVDLGASPTAGILTPIPAKAPTPQQIEDAAKSPKYRAYLKLNGVTVP